MSLLSKLFGNPREAPAVVDAMMGMCVHDPDVFIEPPSNVRVTAAEVLQGRNAPLSPKAKVRFAIMQGPSFAESERKASQDLPELFRGFMRQNGLSPDDYDLRSFPDELRKDTKVLWALAARRTNE